MYPVIVNIICVIYAEIKLYVDLTLCFCVAFFFFSFFFFTLFPPPVNWYGSMKVYKHFQTSYGTVLLHMHSLCLFFPAKEPCFRCQYWLYLPQA